MKAKGILYLVVLLFLCSAALAFDPLNAIIDPFGQINFGSFYESYYGFIDGIIYLLIFLGLTQFVFKKRFDKYAKPIIIGMSLMLSFGAAYFEYRTGFMLGQLAPIAMLILLVVIFFLLYELFRAITEDTVVAFSLALLIAYGMFRSAFGFLYDWLKANSPIAVALLHIAVLAAFILLLIRLFRMFGSGNGTPGAPGTPAGPGAAPGTPAPPGTPPTNPPTPPVAPPQVAITQPTPAQHFAHTDPITLSATITGGTQPYTAEWYINGGNRHGGNSTGTVITSIGVLPPGRYDLAITILDANGIAGADRRDFFVDAPPQPAQLEAQFVEPNPNNTRTFRSDENIPFAMIIRGGVPPYRWVLFTADPHTPIDSRDPENRQNAQFGIRTPISLRTDNQNRLQLGRNIATFLVVDSQNTNVNVATEFIIQDAAGNNLDIEIIEPANNEYDEGVLFDFKWKITKPAYPNNARFEAVYNINGEDIKISNLGPESSKIPVRTKDGNALPAGDYTLKVTVKDPANNRAGTKEKKITVKKPAGASGTGIPLTIVVNNNNPILINQPILVAVTGQGIGTIIQASKKMSTTIELHDKTTVPITKYGPITLSPDGNGISFQIADPDILYKLKHGHGKLLIVIYDDQGKPRAGNGVAINIISNDEVKKQHKKYFTEIFSEIEKINHEVGQFVKQGGNKKNYEAYLKTLPDDATRIKTMEALTKLKDDLKNEKIPKAFFPRTEYLPFRTLLEKIDYDLTKLDAAGSTNLKQFLTVVQSKIRILAQFMQTAGQKKDEIEDVRKLLATTTSDEAMLLFLKIHQWKPERAKNLSRLIKELFTITTRTIKTL